jgi:hypothetical protein
MGPTRKFPWIVAALLAAIGLLTSLAATAKPHEIPEWRDPSGPPTATDVWLRRLAGRYQVEGMVEVRGKGGCPAYCGGIKGKADCVAIGAGPGVQCVLNFTWTDLYETDYESGAIFNVPGGVSYLDPAMMLFGMDTGQNAIKSLLIDNKGLPEGGPGSNTGNRATFRTACVNAPALFSAMNPDGEPYRTCDRTIRFEAKPDANIVYMWIDIDINDNNFTSFVLSLRRAVTTVREDPRRSSLTSGLAGSLP